MTLQQDPTTPAIATIMRKTPRAIMGLSRNRSHCVEPSRLSQIPVESIGTEKRKTKKFSIPTRLLVKRTMMMIEEESRLFGGTKKGICVIRFRREIWIYKVKVKRVEEGEVICKEVSFIALYDYTTSTNVSSSSEDVSVSKRFEILSNALKECLITLTRFRGSD